MPIRRSALAAIVVFALGAPVLSHADQYGLDSAPVPITWQMQPTQRILGRQELSQPYTSVSVRMCCRIQHARETQHDVVV